MGAYLSGLGEPTFLVGTANLELEPNLLYDVFLITDVFKSFPVRS